MKIVLASDHAGRDYRKAIRDRLAALGFEVADLGVADGVTAADYPDYARRAALAVAGGEAERGVLVCGTGTGMAMAANKIKGIRAANCTCEMMARLARNHNDANILTLGARVLGLGLAQDIAEAFMAAGFDGGRHQARLDRLEEDRLEG